MYHFLFVVTKKLFKSISLEKKVDENKEQIIDFCPKCNEKLSDKKVVTLLNHERKFHPKTERELLRDFYRKGSVQMYLLFFIIGVLAVSAYTITYVSAYLWKVELTEEEKNVLVICKDLSEKYPDLGLPFIGDAEQGWIDRKAFILENIEELEKCAYKINIFFLGSKQEQIDNYLSWNSG